MIRADVCHGLGLNGGDQNRSEKHIVHTSIEEVPSVERLCHHGGESVASKTIWILDKIEQN